MWFNFYWYIHFYSYFVVRRSVFDFFLLIVFYCLLEVVRLLFFAGLDEEAEHAFAFDEVLEGIVDAVGLYEDGARAGRDFALFISLSYIENRWCHQARPLRILAINSLRDFNWWVVIGVIELIVKVLQLAECLILMLKVRLLDRIQSDCLLFLDVKPVKLPRRDVSIHILKHGHGAEVDDHVLALQQIVAFWWPDCVQIVEFLWILKHLIVCVSVCLFVDIVIWSTLLIHWHSRLDLLLLSSALWLVLVETANEDQFWLVWIIQFVLVLLLVHQIVGLKIARQEMNVLIVAAVQRRADR